MPSSRRLPQTLRFSLVAGAACVALSACAVRPARQAGLRPSEGADAALGADDRGGSSYGLYLAGEAAIDSGSSRDAAAYFRRASALAPDAGDIRGRAFSAALLSGEIERAAELAPGAESGPNPEALGQLVRAVQALAAGRGKAAEAELAGVHGAGRTTAALALLQPWAAAAAGDNAASLAPVASGGSGAVESFAALEHAELLERAGRLPEAGAVYRDELADRAGVFALAYGGFLERRGRRAEALAIYDKSLAKTPEDAALQSARVRAAAGRPPPPQVTVRQGAGQALIGPAAVVLSQHEAELGLAYLRLALALDPGLDAAWMLVGDAMASAGDKTAARDAYGRVGPVSPDYVAARGRLALLLEDDGNKAGALALARGTLAAAPDDSRAQLVVADLLRDGERYDEAVVVLNQLIRTAEAKAGGKGGADWRLYYLRGACEERSNHWDAAQADLQHALTLKPDDPEVLNYLGYAWVDRGERLTEALGMLQKATELQPNSGAIVDSLGWARYRLHDYPAAVRELEKAVSLDPADPDVNNHLGDAYWRSGRRLEAQYQWRRVLSLGDVDPKLKASAEAKLASGLQPGDDGAGRP